MFLVKTTPLQKLKGYIDGLSVLSKMYIKIMFSVKSPRQEYLLNRFSTRRNIPRAAESLLFFIEFCQIRTLKSRIKFNFSAAENSANQSYCSLCVPRDQNNSRSVRMIPSSGKPALNQRFKKPHKIKKYLNTKCNHDIYQACFVFTGFLTPPIFLCRNFHMCFSI